MAAAFYDDLAAAGDAPALVFPSGRVLTYANLGRRVEEQARRFGSRKALIAVEARTSEHAVIAYLAALKGGHAVSVLPPDDAFAARRFIEEFRPDFHVRERDGRWRCDDVSHPEAGPTEALHPDLALLLSTSGSTGQGRFVRLSATAVAANAGQIAEYQELAPDDCGALVLPLHYSYGLSVLNAHLAARASLFLADKAILDTGFVDDLRRARCTNLPGVPYSFELLDRIGFRDADLPDLRFMTVAGGKLAPHLVERWHVHLALSGRRFFVMYGQTEATARIAYLPPDLVAGNTDHIGIAIPGGELSLVDEHGRTVTGPGVAGELVYRGPNVMMGYATARADLARGAEVELLRTGDLAERDAAGLYRIVGRLRRMSKIAGLRIGHDAVEHALAADGIAAAVVGDDRAITAVHTSGRSEREVRRLVIERTGLPAAHVRVAGVEALPRLPSGKIDYERLRSDLAGHPEEDAEDVDGVFRQVFFPQEVRPGDSFVSLGGDSLRYVQLTVGLERALGHVPEGWETKTVRQLAAVRRDAAARPVIGSDLIVRALAVLLVVTHHATLWPIPGGAAAMMMLVGFGLARFQREPLLSGDHRHMIRSTVPLLVPYGLILAGYAAAWGHVPWASVFLVGNFGIADPDHQTMLPLQYWFVEAYVQLIVVLSGVLLVPAVRRYARREPFGFGLAFLAAALVFRFVGPALWEIGWRRIFTLPWNLYLVAFGWCAVFATSLRRKLTLLALAAVVMPVMAYDGGNWVGGWVKFMLQIPVLSVLLFLPRISVPRSLFALVMPVAVAGYHIYLFHPFIHDLMHGAFGESFQGPAYTLSAVIGGVGLGLAAYKVQEKALALIARLKAPSAARVAPMPAE